MEVVSLTRKLLVIRHVLSVTVVETCCCSCGYITDGLSSLKRRNYCYVNFVHRFYTILVVIIEIVYMYIVLLSTVLRQSQVKLYVAFVFPQV